MRLRARFVVAVALGALASFGFGTPAAEADVKLGVSPEGRRMIFNESSVQRGRRLSTKLVAIPDAELQPLIVRHSGAQNLDPKLVQALIQVESGYNSRALSRKGAMGLMQLMPGTASLLRVQNPYDPDENVRGGTTYLRRMLDRFAGRLEWAVAAYNAGPGAVERHRGIPPFRETRDYVRRVLALYQGNDSGLPVLSGGFVVPASGTAGVGAGAVGSVGGMGRVGRKTYLTRNAQNRLVVTTSLDGIR